MAFTFTPLVTHVYNSCEAQRINTNRVYLIYRLDENDATLGVIWDSGYTPGRVDFFNHGVPIYHPIDKLQRVARNNSACVLGENGKASGPRLRGYTYEQSVNQTGGHAEEFFLQKLMMLPAAPKMIDVYISRIPCAATSMSWSFAFGGANMRLPEGCGPKLYTAMRLTPQIQWSLAYGEGYNGAMQTSCEANIDRMNQLPNVVAGHLTDFL